MVVLPFVPVTPTSFSDDEGLPKKFEAACPRAFAESFVFTHVTFLSVVSGSVSHIIADAPDLTAPSIKSCPSLFDPLTATKRDPVDTLRESKVILSISSLSFPVKETISIPLNIFPSSIILHVHIKGNYLSFKISGSVFGRLPLHFTFATELDSVTRIFKKINCISEAHSTDIGNESFDDIKSNQPNRVSALPCCHPVSFCSSFVSYIQL